jgi:Toastrack DUF4097
VKSVIGVLAALSLATTACSHAGSDPRAFEWAADVPAGAVVHLRNGSGEIEVRRVEGRTVRIDASRRWSHGHSSDIRFAVTRRGNDYYVCAMWRHSGDCGAKGYRGISPGFLSMLSLFHHTTDAAADFVADVPADVVVDVSTTKGSIRVDGMTAGVTARTANGDVRAVNVAGPLSLATSNGNVQLSADALSDTDPINLTTKNGVIQADLPPGLEGSFDLSVLNGSVKTDLPLAPANRHAARNHLRGQIGTSTRTVKMRALNGSVVVTRRATAVGHN